MEGQGPKLRRPAHAALSSAKVVDSRRAKVSTITLMDNEQRWRSRDRWWRRQSQINLGIALVLLAFMAWKAACP